MKFNELYESIINEDRSSAIFHAKNILKKLGYSIKGLKFGFKNQVVYLNDNAFVSDSSPDEMEKWIKTAITKEPFDNILSKN